MTDTTESALTPESSATSPQGSNADGSPAPLGPAFPPDSSGNNAVWLAGALALIVVIALLIAFVGFLRHWVAQHTGTLHGGPDVYYNFWSGFGSDLGEATLISAVGVGVYAGLRKVNCHTKGCWRIGRHHLEGTPYILCRHHHPDVPNGGATHEHILNEHHKYKVQQQALKDC